jgi:hypothetical protein
MAMVMKMAVAVLAKKLAPAPRKKKNVGIQHFNWCRAPVRCLRRCSRTCMAFVVRAMHPATHDNASPRSLKAHPSSLLFFFFYQL